MSIYVTHAPTVSLTSYDTKRSSHLKRMSTTSTFYISETNLMLYVKVFCD